MSAAPAPAPAPSRWRAGPRRLARLLTGLWLFGFGEGLLVVAGLGNSPWTVLAEGVSEHAPLAVGVATIAISAVVLLLWIPLRQRPGLGTIANAIVIGLAIDVAGAVVPDQGQWAVRAGLLAAGIALVALGSGIYLGAALGPGPRDGLMTGLHRVTGRGIGVIRTAIEGSALLGGFMLGGTVGIGTVAFAVTIGPGVAWMLGALSSTPAREL